MARQFLDMQTRVAEMTSLTLAGTDLTRLKELINEAIVDFARDAATNPVLTSFNTVINQQNYALTGVTANGALRILPDAEGTNRAFDIAVRGLTTVVLSTIPTSVFAVSVWAVPRPTELVANTDVFPFEREWYRGVLYRAAQLVAEWDNQDVPVIQMFETKYEGEVAKARRQAKHMQGQSLQGLQPSASLNTSNAAGRAFPFSL